MLLPGRGGYRRERFAQLNVGSSTVVLVNSDLIDKWGLSIIHQLPFGPVFTALMALFLDLFRGRAALQLEILALRHQIGVLQRSVKRPRLTTADRALWVWLRSVWEDWKSGVHIVQASTVVGWHRQGFRMFWTWKIRRGRSGARRCPTKSAY